MSGYIRSPPPPLAPPPSRETDVAFGVILVLTGVVLLAVVGYVLVRQVRRSPPSLDGKPPSSTTEKADTFYAPNDNSTTDYTDGDETEAHARAASFIAPTVLRPFRL